MTARFGLNHHRVPRTFLLADTTIQNYRILSVSTGYFALVKASVEEAQRAYQADQQSNTANRVRPVN